ncbi:hypothetical protein CF319_g2232 [Tilletia indica]|nr:hypothetical protein CF319_g2232 [Tilletia indica]
MKDELGVLFSPRVCSCIDAIASQICRSLLLHLDVQCTPPAVPNILYTDKKEKLYTLPDRRGHIRVALQLRRVKQMFLDRDTYADVYDHNILEATNGLRLSVRSFSTTLHTRHDSLSKVIFEPFFGGNFEKEDKQHFVSRTRAQIAKCAFRKGTRRR